MADISDCSTAADNFDRPMDNSLWDIGMKVENIDMKAGRKVGSSRKSRAETLDSRIDTDRSMLTMLKTLGSDNLDSRVDYIDKHSAGCRPKLLEALLSVTREAD